MRVPGIPPARKAPAPRPPPPLRSIPGASRGRRVSAAFLTSPSLEIHKTCMLKYVEEGRSACLTIRPPGLGLAAHTVSWRGGAGCGGRKTQAEKTEVRSGRRTLPAHGRALGLQPLPGPPARAARQITDWRPPRSAAGGGPLAGLASPASSSGLAATCRCPQEGGGGPRGPAEGSGVRVSAQPVSGGTRNAALAVCCLVQGARISSRHGANVRSLTAGFPFLCATSSRLAVSRIVGGRLTLDANISATTGECSPVRTAKVRLKGKQLALTPSFKRN